MPKKSKQKDNSRRNSGNDVDGQRSENISDELLSEKFALDLQAGDQSDDPVPVGAVRPGQRSGTLSRRRFLGGMGAAAVVAAVGCKDGSPSGDDVDGGPDPDDDGGVDVDGRPDILEDGGVVVVEDGGQNGGEEVPDLSTLRAFPGAEGGGALSVGGRGGQIVEVNTLDDNGDDENPIVGSLRWAVTRTYPRTVVFSVGGTIELQARLRIRNSYLTIAGQTAPGGGIQLSGKQIPERSSHGTALWISGGAHDIVIRYLRIRKGISTPSDPGGEDAVGIYGNSYNLMFDHCSLYWGHDDVWQPWGWNTAPNRVTIQNSIIAEPLEGHATVTLAGASRREGRLTMVDVDMIKNFICQSTHRNPSFVGQSGRFINNIIYNYRRGGGPQIGAGCIYDVISNISREGPVSGSSSAWFLRAPGDDEPPPADTSSIGGDPSIYVRGNLSDIRPDIGPDDDNWELTYRATTANNVADERLPLRLRRYEMQSVVGAPIDEIPVTELEDTLLGVIGDSRGLDWEGRWVPRRDFQDVRVVQWYHDKAGHIIAAEDAPDHNPDQAYIIDPDLDAEQSYAIKFAVKHNNGIYLTLPRTDVPVGVPITDTNYWEYRHEHIGGFPEIASGPAYPCTAGDGISDVWKTNNGITDLTTPMHNVSVANALGKNIHEDWTFLDLFLAGIDDLQRVP